MDKRLICLLVSCLPKRVNNTSVLVTKASRRLDQILVSRLLLINIVFFIGPRVPLKKTSRLRLSLVAKTRSYGYLSRSFRILMRLRRALCFWIRRLRSVIDCKYSTSMYLDYASTSQLYRLMLKPSTDPVRICNI